MRIRSLAPIAVAVALGGALVLPSPAHAAQTVTVKPETFAGGAASRALDLSLLGNKLTLGDTVANIVKGVSDTGATTLLAKAVGTGVLSLLGNTVADSTLTSAGTKSAPKSCAVPNLLEPLAGILDIGLACGASSASIDTNNLLNTLATGQVGDVELSLNTLLHTLGLDQIVQTAEGAVAALPVGSLVNTLLGVTNALQLPALNVNVTDLLSTVLNGVLNTKTLSLTIGDAVSKVTNTVNTVTASSHSSAVDLKILPDVVPGVLNTLNVGATAAATNVLHQPLLEVIVAEANATATYDRLTGKAVGDPTFDPAIVHIKGLLVDTLGLGGLLGGVTGGAQSTPGDGIKLALGQDITLLAGTPLETTIKLGAGKIVDDGVFGKKAVADGVSIQALKGISGGIILDLAHAEAGAIDNLAQTKVLDIPSIETSRDIATPTALPRTGAETTIPLAFAGLAIAAVAIRRYRMVAAVASK